MARIWSRFYYTQNRMIDDLEPKDYFAGFLAHRFIVLFLNALLIECHRFNKFTTEGGDPIEMELRNPTLSDRIFHNNLRHWEMATNTETSLFDYLFSCPLWGLFISQETKEYSFYQMYRDHCTAFLEITEENSASQKSVEKDSSSQESIKKENPLQEIFEVTFNGTQKFPNLYAPMNSLAIQNRWPQTGNVFSRFFRGSPKSTRKSVSEPSIDQQRYLGNLRDVLEYYKEAILNLYTEFDRPNPTSSEFEKFVEEVNVRIVDKYFVQSWRSPKKKRLEMMEILTKFIRTNVD